MTVADLVRRAQDLIKNADAVLGTERNSVYTIPVVDEGAFSGFRAAALSFLTNVYGDKHPYFTDFDDRCKESIPSAARAGREIIRAVEDELTGGWLVTARGLLSAEIFADFLEMADHLLQHGYKDAAAVIIGSVLEEHLRQLCVTNAIATYNLKGTDQIPKKADTLNAELVAAGVYNRLDQKSATAWLDLRNKGAHGKYTEYTQQQVELMRQAVGDFMARIPV